MVLCNAPRDRDVYMKRMSTPAGLDSNNDADAGLLPAVWMLYGRIDRSCRRRIVCNDILCGNRWTRVTALVLLTGAPLVLIRCMTWLAVGVAR